MSFNQPKTAQAAAWIASKCQNPINVMKLTKLLYLSERATLDRYGYSLTGDKMVSMPFGPVLSTTLNVINGEGRSRESWEAWVASRQGNSVASNKTNASRAEFDELSDAEIAIIEFVCDSFGHMDQWQLSDYTHNAENCPEWTDPQGSSYPITYKNLFKALGRDDEQARVLAERVKDDESVDLVLSRL